MTPTPDFEPENQVPCEGNGGGIHSWIWEEEQDDWYCDACSLWQEHQEN